MNWKILLSAAIVSLSFIAFLVYVNRESDPDRLFTNLIMQMQEGQYEAIYENSSDFLKLNAKNKQTFAERMSNALEIMKQADSNLDFQRDSAMERTLDEVTDNGRNESGKHFWIVNKLGSNNDSVQIVASYDNNGLFPKLIDLTVRSKSNKQQKISALTGTF